MKHPIQSFFLSLALILILPGCVWKGINTDQSLQTISQSTRTMTSAPVTWDQDADYTQENNIIDIDPAQGLSREQAVGIALMNNASLQADFEKLGIAKADLVQAGLFTNPQLNMLVQKSSDIDDKSQLILIASFSFSDLWLVPLKQNVARDEVDLVTHRILTTILSIIAQTKHAYNDCIIAQESIIDSTPDHEKITLMNELNDALIRLKKLMGIPINLKPIRFTSSLHQHIQELPAIDDLEYYALQNHPSLRIAELKIDQAHHVLKMQRARVFKDVRVGVTYARDFDRSHGVGPYIGLEVPLFDRNNAQIAGACYRIKLAKKEFEEVKSEIMSELYYAYNKLNAALQVMALENNHDNPLELHYNTLTAQTDLEKAMGGSLETIVGEYCSVGSEAEASACAGTPKCALSKKPAALMSALNLKNGGTLLR